MRLPLLLIFSLFINALSAQTAALTGSLRSSATGLPLEGATVVTATGGANALTDAAGRFRLDSLAPGRHTIQIRLIGYAPLTLPDLLLRSAAPLEVNLEMDPTAADLPPVRVTAPRVPEAALNPLARVITLEEVRRYPVAFDDPGRLAARQAGVRGTNDQGNAYSVRGNAPSSNAWRLNGLQIVNPSHTSNAGTASDLPTYTAGGVNAVSAQVLDNSVLYTGGLPAHYGNAPGGLLDMRMRPGRTDATHGGVQASFIGLEATGEGALNQARTASFLINARYSFTGLLTDVLQVDFDGESISFRDINVYINVPFGKDKRNRLSFFGVTGESNNFAPARPPAEIEDDKDASTIRFNSKMLIVGSEIDLRLTRRLRLRGVAGFSRAVNSRLQSDTDTLPDPMQSFNELDYERFNVPLRLTYALAAGSEVEVGAEYLSERTLIGERDRLFTDTFFRRNLDDRYTATVLSPFAAYRVRGRHWNLEAGLRLSIYGRDLGFSEAITEPRLRIGYRFSEATSITASAERVTQINSFVLSRRVPGTLTDKLPVTDRAELRINHRFAPIADFTVTPFYQITRDDYGLTLPGDSGGIITLASDYAGFERGLLFDRQLDFSRRLGIEYSLSESPTERGWFYLLTGSFVFADFRAFHDNGGTFDALSRYDRVYTQNLTVGKEWKRTPKGDCTRTWGVSAAAALHTNGQNTQSISPDSREAGYSIYGYVYEESISVGPGTYFRTDLRLYLRSDRPKRNTTLSLDIQNVTNRENVSFYYLDRLSNRLTPRYQLGLIPVLSYRVQW